MTMSKPIILDKDSKIAELEKVINEAQGKARVRRISTSTVINTLAKVQKQLDIPKKSMKGISISVDYYAQKFPSAHKGILESTQFSAEYDGRHWRITNVYRAKCRYSGEVIINHTEESKKAIINRFSVLSI